MKKAIVTVYHPSKIVRDNILAIVSQVDKVYICDNSPIENSELFKYDDTDKIEYIFFGENLGLSRAFNKVLKESNAWENDDFVLFFDQDSHIKQGHIDKLINEYDCLLAKGYNVGCLGPVFFNTSNNTVEVPKMKTPLTENSFKVSSIITSSMVCRYADIKEIDFWNERVFLDMADWDFCWRMVKKGKLCCMTDAVVLEHSLGTGEKKVGFLKLRIGNVFREYYQTRECLYLLTRSYSPLKYKIRFIAMLTVRPIIHLIFLENRKNRFKYICMGVRDFFKKKSGSLDV